MIPYSGLHTSFSTPCEDNQQIDLGGGEQRGQYAAPQSTPMLHLHGVADMHPFLETETLRTHKKPARRPTSRGSSSRRSLEGKGEYLYRASKNGKQRIDENLYLK